MEHTCAGLGPIARTGGVVSHVALTGTTRPAILAERPIAAKGRGMSNLQVQTSEGPQGPPFELDCHILTIRAQSEAEFMAGFEEHFWALMHSESARVTVDLARSDGMADDAFRMIALNMFEIGNRGKAITIRIPETLERFFKHANLYRVADIEVVRLLGKKRPELDEKPVETPDPQPPHSESGVELPATTPSAAMTAVVERPSDTQILKVELQQRYAQQVAAEREARQAAEAAAESGATIAPAVRTGRGRLVDRRTGQIVDITKSPTNIGRVPGNDILIAMPLVSKRHARITIEENAYFIEDLGSSNGTFVNGVRIGEKSLLADGAKIQVAITSQYPNGAKEYTFRQDES